MPSRRLTFPAVAVLALACLLLGALAAFADGGGSDGRTRATAARASARAVTARIVVAARRGHYTRGPVFFAPGAACAVRSKPPAAAPVPQGLLDAFGVLRRDRTATDALPERALTALRDAGLEPFDPAAARLLRTTADGGQAWVVPVRDVPDTFAFSALGIDCVVRGLGATRPFVLKAPVPPRPARRAAPARPRTATAPDVTPPAPAPAPPTTTTPTATAPRPAPSTTPAVPVAPVAPKPVTATPHPGLAVVAVGGAPAGAGGRLEDLVRGREPVVTDPCGGPDHDMLSVSGIVPDGVPAAFLTSPDGTAIRADVKDNAYAFTIPRPKAREQRYVVSTGGDGTPHVQPLSSPVFFGPRLRCATSTGLPADRIPPVVSPNGSGFCGIVGRPIPLPTTPTGRRGPLLLDRAPCVISTPTVKALPRLPKRHK
jgi:hypothetical protein